MKICLSQTQNRDGHRRQRQDFQKSKSTTHPFSLCSFSFTSLLNPYAQILPFVPRRRCRTLYRPPRRHHHHHHHHQSLSLLSTRSEYHAFLFPFKMVLELLSSNTSCIPLDLLVLDVVMASFNGLLAFVAFSQVSCSSRNCKQFGGFSFFLGIFSFYNFNFLLTS